MASGDTPSDSIAEITFRFIFAFEYLLNEVFKLESIGLWAYLFIYRKYRYIYIYIHMYLSKYSEHIKQSREKERPAHTYIRLLHQYIPHILQIHTFFIHTQYLFGKHNLMVYSMQTIRGLCCKFCIFICLAINFLKPARRSHANQLSYTARGPEFEYLKILIIALHMNSIICSSRSDIRKVRRNYFTHNARSDPQIPDSLASSHAL